ARNDYETVMDRHRSAQAAVESAKASIRALEAAVKRAAVLLEYTVIRAPFDGVVLTKDADVGEVVAPFGSAVTARAAVVTMADLASLMVQADVAESSLSKVRAGQSCEILLDSMPDTRFPGKVHMIVPTADRARGTVQAKVAFDSLDPRILPEMSAKVAFLSRPLAENETRPFLGIHRDAVVKRDTGTGCFAVLEDRAVWLPLSGEEPFGDYVMLPAPAREGETVVLKPPAGLKSGDVVKVAD
ncbi:MAG: efflux RND transporter periplasmic adaptor subunit, partial [Desulfobacteraceae bacterium]|nr:efflux RND transporter periplasmic adaptor subunit [Desulfobacteraceae bacterium]